MISEWMVIALLSMPCHSNVTHTDNVTIVSMCPLPSMQGPPRPPIGWRPGMLHDTNKEILNRKSTKVIKYDYKPKNKKRKKRRR